MVKQKGLSLVELMISAVISVIIIQGIFELFFSNLVAAKYQESRSLARERAQQAFFLMTQDIREAGSGGDPVATGGYNVYYNQRFSGYSAGSALGNDVTVPTCRLECDNANNCIGFSWANVYVVDGLPAGLSDTSDDPCSDGSEGTDTSSAGTGDPVIDSLQPLQEAINQLVDAKNQYETGVGTPPTTDEQTQLDEYTSLEDELNQEYTDRHTQYANEENNGNFDQTDATNDVFNYLLGKQVDLTDLGVSIDSSSTGTDDEEGGVCSSNPAVVTAAEATGRCWLQARPSSGRPSRSNRDAWVTYLRNENTLFYSDECGGVECTSDGSGTNSDSLAIVLSPTNGRDCTGTSTSSSVVVNRYFIDDDSDGNNGLYCQSYNQSDGSSRGSEQLMVEGVERLQVLFGYSDDGESFITSYREADDITDWLYVRSVHIGVLVGGSDLWGSTAERDRTYNIMGTGNFTMSDSRKEYYPFTTVQRLYTNRDDTSWREKRLFRSE